MSNEAHLLPEAECQVLLANSGGIAWTPGSCGDLAVDVGAISHKVKLQKARPLRWAFYFAAMAEYRAAADMKL